MAGIVASREGGIFNSGNDGVGVFAESSMAATGPGAFVYFKAE